MTIMTESVADDTAPDWSIAYRLEIVFDALDSERADHGKVNLNERR